MMPLVSVASCEPRYPRAPFDASTAYPEYPFAAVSATSNSAYDGVRRSLALLGLDEEHFGTRAWNPLRDIVRRGATVVVKPNWVYHEQPGELRPEEILITH